MAKNKKTLDTKRIFHKFEPTDSIGYSMVCVQCGRHIYFEETNDWDKAQEEECLNKLTYLQQEHYMKKNNNKVFTEIPYTFGKWEITRWASHRHVHVSCNDGYGNMIFIADCGNEKSEDGLPYNPAVIANANLIAAAPDLHSVAEIALDLAKKVLHEHPNDDIIQEQKLKIEAALNKVNGKNANK
jgi:hypothetical protein